MLANRGFTVRKIKVLVAAIGDPLINGDESAIGGIYLCA